MTYDILTAYGDMSVCVVMAMMLNPYAVEEIVQNMDALNQALMWLRLTCPKVIITQAGMIF